MQLCTEKTACERNTQIDTTILQRAGCNCVLSVQWNVQCIVWNAKMLAVNKAQVQALQIHTCVQLRRQNFLAAGHQNLHWGTFKNCAFLPHFGPLRPPGHSRSTTLSSRGTCPGLLVSSPLSVKSDFTFLESESKSTKMQLSLFK